jgi:hypothetical protein
LNQKAAWRRFVEQRRRELHDAHPCAAPTRRRICPKHHIRVPQETYVRRRSLRTGRRYIKRVPLSGICMRCRDALYDQLVAEYLAAKTDSKGDTA